MVMVVQHCECTLVALNCTFKVVKCFRIYQSLDYIEDNATVFHAYYLSAVANAEIKNSVALGHFILPPACLQKEIRRKIGSFIWEQDQHHLIEQHDEVTPNEIKTLRENSELATEHKKELSKRY
nr:telomere repeats-binding bouquet formation protein 2-like [Symphalangus syndactylus]